MNPVDVAIVLVVALGLYLGWSRGLIGPLVGEGTFLLGLWLISTHPNLLSAQLPRDVPRPLALLGLLSVVSVAAGLVGGIVLRAVFRMPLVRQVDKLLGAALHGLLAFVIVYVVLIGLAGTDKVLGPINGVVSIRSQQIAAVRTLLSQYPQAASVVGASELGRLADAASARPVPFDQLGQYAGVISWYERALRPQLATSHLAGLVVDLGQHLPIIGQRVTLPTS